MRQIIMSRKADAPSRCQMWDSQAHKAVLKLGFEPSASTLKGDGEGITSKLALNGKEDVRVLILLFFELLDDFPQACLLNFHKVWVTRKMGRLKIRKWQELHIYNLK